MPAPKAVRRKPVDETPAAQDNTPQPETTATKGLVVTGVEPCYALSVRIRLSDGSKLELLAAGGQSYDANKAIAARAVEAIKNTLR